MQRRKFKQNKLWRDRAIDLMEQMGSKIHWTRLSADEFAEELKVKLLEEVQEVCRAGTRDAVLEELADVLELVYSFCDLHGASLQDIINLREKKHQERGGFQGRRFVTVAEHPIGGFGEKYCLADPGKYPEIID
jgi:predicted house-cleaning noncanonical NTP pyrophosphatase (MazG superfamily)